MQPSPNKLATRKRSNGVKKRPALIPCEDDFGADTRPNKTRKKTNLNLYILGKLWIDLLSKALVGEKLDITSVKATQTRESQIKKNEMTPQLPKIQYQTSIIKYKDLPLYRDQNIVEYDKETDGKKLFAENVTRLQNFFTPYVSYCRTTLQRSFIDVTSYVLSEFDRRKDVMVKGGVKIRENMSDPDKLPFRYTAAATGGITGYILSAGGGMSRRVIFTSIGLLSTGVVCFPKESDRVFKDVMYGAAKVCVYLYNTVTDEKLQLSKDNEMNDVSLANTNTEILKCPSTK